MVGDVVPVFEEVASVVRDVAPVFEDVASVVGDIATGVGDVTTVPAGVVGGFTAPDVAAASVGSSSEIAFSAAEEVARGRYK